MADGKLFAGGRWTLSRYRQFVVSALRGAFVRYPVRADALAAARRAATDEDKLMHCNKRIKWVYQCASCNDWFVGADVQVDHIVECGHILTDATGFIGRLFCEEDGLQVLCIGCHRAKKKPRRDGPVRVEVNTRLRHQQPMAPVCRGSSPQPPLIES